jgi:ABC-type oligopeptide transport system ATPase subunit
MEAALSASRFSSEQRRLVSSSRALKLHTIITSEDPVEALTVAIKANDTSLVHEVANQ